MGRRRECDDQNRETRSLRRLAGFPRSARPPQVLVEVSEPVSNFSDTSRRSSKRALAMKLAIAPPHVVTAGVALKSSVVVTFEVSDSERHHRQDDISMRDTSGIWAFVSLMAEDGSQSLAPPRTDLLRGRTADSIHPILQPQHGDIQTIGYVTFPDLVITEPGRYRLRINVIDMNNVVFDESNNGGRVLEPLHSKVFQVVQTAHEHDLPDPQTISRLREIGVSV